MRCFNNIAEKNCDCNQCNCFNKLCGTCLKTMRCRNCSIHCRNWLSSFFQKESFTSCNISNASSDISNPNFIANETSNSKSIGDQKQKKILSNPLSLPVVDNKLKMTRFTILAEWETNVQHYDLDLTNRIHRKLLYRSKKELEYEIHLQKNVLPLREKDSDDVKNLQFELFSINNQYQNCRNEIDKKCKYCFEQLNPEETQRHNDYHIQRQLLLLKEQNSCDDSTRLSIHFGKKNSLENATKNAFCQINNSIRDMTLAVEKLFQNIKEMVVVFPFVPITKRTCDNQTLETNDSQKNKKYKSSILCQDDDNITCKCCKNDFGFPELNKDQDWIYNPNVLRINDSLYCSLRCVQYSLSIIQCEQSTKNQTDNLRCPECNRFFAYYQSGSFFWYYNDFVYDVSCNGTDSSSCNGIDSQYCTGNSCATMRVNDVVFCNAKCAGFL